MNATSYPINLTTKDIIGIYLADLHDAAEAEDPKEFFFAVDAKVQVTLNVHHTLPGLLPEGLYEVLCEHRLTWADFEREYLRSHPHF